MIYIKQKTRIKSIAQLKFGNLHENLLLILVHIVTF
jgi:hypothetical protein